MSSLFKVIDELERVKRMSDWGGDTRVHLPGAMVNEILDWLHAGARAMGYEVDDAKPRD